MICPKCKGEDFILTTTKLVIEDFKILKNGKLAKTPYSRNEDTLTTGEWDNSVVCQGCSSMYYIKHMGYDDFMNDYDFSKVDLRDDGVLYDRIEIVKKRGHVCR